MPPGAPTPVQPPKRVYVVGYTTVDGVRHECEAYVTPQGPDSLRLEVFRDSTGDVARTVWIARGEVESLRIRQSDPSKTQLLGLAVVVGVLVFFAVGAVASEGFW